ncbi:MAG: S-formylglutathione hydrolase [Pseudomonadaceae bacterium]|nr:S-formylglutathione hydrolase [Pseudomonadaceae bacterium]
MAFDEISSNRMFGGVQSVYRHDSSATSTAMEFAVYRPDSATGAAVVFLSGLTCTWENFTVKAGAQRMASELGLTIIAPDTSPRGGSVPDDPGGAYDFGLGAGFYVDATQAPWSANYRMRSYVLSELLPGCIEEFDLDASRIGISGHSMGGHGALTLALGAPGTFASVSAFAPICAPSQCPWGEKALAGYLGDDRSGWRGSDAVALIEDGARLSEVLVDVGLDDAFLAEQLRIDLLESACSDADIGLTLRRQAGFDHSYYTIATFIDDHMNWHAQRLGLRTE